MKTSDIPNVRLILEAMYSNVDPFTSTNWPNGLGRCASTCLLSWSMKADFLRLLLSVTMKVDWSIITSSSTLCSCSTSWLTESGLTTISGLEGLYGGTWAAGLGDVGQLPISSRSGVASPKFQLASQSFKVLDGLLTPLNHSLMACMVTAAVLQVDGPGCTTLA